MKITFRKAEVNDVKTIQDIAEKTWWPTYSSILTKEQIRYMLDTIYSTEVLTNAVKNNTQEFYMLEEDAKAVGFASFSERENEAGVYKLHKIYVLPETQGKGYGKYLVDKVKEAIALRNSRTLDLNVNRYNPAKTFYEKLGFVVIQEEDIPIGPYWMNDYVMRLSFSLKYRNSHSPNIFCTS